MSNRERHIILFQLANGKVPFEVWADELDPLLRRAVDARLTRIADGNFGDHKSVGGGVFELRVNKGPGLRVYYALKGCDLVILLGGGDKKSQRRDIERAIRMWRRAIDKK